MHYRIFGPYRLEKNNNKNISTDQAEFWESAIADCSKIEDARGVYIFGIRSSGGNRIFPWYVGRSAGTNFGNEIFHSDKLVKYRDIVDQKPYIRYLPYMFLIPRYTAKGRVSTIGNEAEIQHLERIMIELALRANPKLYNTQGTAFLRQIVVPGVFNSPRRRPRIPETEIRISLGLN